MMDACSHPEDTMPKKTKDTLATQVGVRLDAKTLERVDAVAARHSLPGLDLTRAAAIRIALAAGLDALEKQARR